MKNFIKSVFIVGTPRSGTTFLQSLLIRHQDILSFPETHFYRRLYLLPLPVVGLPQTHLRKAMRKIDQEDLLADYPLFATKKNKSEWFLMKMSELAHSKGKKLWIEKTPSHLKHISEIDKSVPNALFIHVIRRSEDVIASLCDVAWRSGDGFDDRVEHYVRRWRNDYRISYRYQDSPNHIMLKYEDLLADKDGMMSKLFKRMGLDPDCLQEVSPLESILVEDEKWATDIKSTDFVPERKFEKLFSLRQQRMISSTVSKIVSAKPIIYFS